LGGGGGQPTNLVRRRQAPSNTIKVPSPCDSGLPFPQSAFGCGLRLQGESPNTNILYYMSMGRAVCIAGGETHNLPEMDHKSRPVPDCCRPSAVYHYVGYLGLAKYHTRTTYAQDLDRFCFSVLASLVRELVSGECPPNAQHLRHQAAEMSASVTGMRSCASDTEFTYHRLVPLRRVVNEQVTKHLSALRDQTHQDHSKTIIRPVAIAKLTPQYKSAQYTHLSPIKRFSQLQLEQTAR